MPSARRAFVVMPFGAKPGPDGKDIDFDAIYDQLLAPAVRTRALLPIAPTPTGAAARSTPTCSRTSCWPSSSSPTSRSTIPMSGMKSACGMRSAPSGTVLTYALRDRLPFDIAGQRMQRYSLAGGQAGPRAARRRAARHRRGDHGDARRLARAQGEPGLPAIARSHRARLEEPQGRRRQPVLAGARGLAQPDRDRAAASSGRATYCCWPTKRPTACSNSRLCAPQPTR